MTKNKYILKNCFYVFEHRIGGNCYGNPFFKDGTSITTSIVQNIKEFEDHKEIETLNSIYCIYPEDNENYEFL